MAKTGRKKIVWSDREFKIFENLCRIGWTIDKIEDTMSIDAHTLNRLIEEHYGEGCRFSVVSKRFSNEARSRVVNSLLDQSDTKPGVAIFLAKNMLGMSDNPIGVQEAAKEIDSLSAALKDLANSMNYDKR